MYMQLHPAQDIWQGGTLPALSGALDDATVRTLEWRPGRSVGKVAKPMFRSLCQQRKGMLYLLASPFSNLGDSRKLHPPSCEAEGG